jgi:hypothetical protein
LFPSPIIPPKSGTQSKEVLGYILNNLHTKSWQHGGAHFGSFFSLFLTLAMVLILGSKAYFFGAWYDTSNHL